MTSEDRECLSCCPHLCHDVETIKTSFLLFLWHVPLTFVVNGLVDAF